ncbi:hypothetical protein LCGC14_1662900 [marine sediment metagenome]|uniref:Uncharacterized protein n=1 Tax=marine sediment metagenome TaxID=412755 RepID=A0A0F9K9D5_9ZZZZ
MIIMILIAILQIIFSIGIVGFWIYFLLVENKNPERTKVYLVFEKSFIIPDLGWVTPCLLISAFGLITNQKFWIFFSISAGSAILFLFFLDFSFNVQQGNYKKEKRKDNIIEIAVNILSAVSGPLFMLYGYINL